MNALIPGKEILTINADMSYICYEIRLISMQGETQLIIPSLLIQL